MEFPVWLHHTGNSNYMNYARFLSLCTSALLLSACGSRNHLEKQATLAMEMTALDTAGGLVAFAGQGNATLAAPAPVIPQKIIRNASIRFVVSDFAPVRSRIAQTVSKAGGYIANETENRTSLELRNQLEIKIPLAQFDSCVEALTSGVFRLDEKSITSQDVTEEYIDLDARMKARMETEKRYLQFLQQAKNVKEVLEVEDKLKDIREEVEAAKGRLQYLDHHAALSTIHLTYYQTFANTDPQSPGFFQRALLALKDGWNNLLGLSVSLLSMWPLMTGIIFLVIFIRARIKRWKRRIATTPVPANVNQ
ncbi:DUF4349 domain-containing protein [Chitinophaga sp. MM2321]|uniref:DUF4349 domain-containing protein n=1 Tax=Chitinophaga sp. MM2321 TaxID=3137178 RepID=UPI0032D58628